MTKPSQDSEASSAVKPRSPFEKLVVWGLILGLGSLAGCEYMTRVGHEKSIDVVDDAYRRSLSRVSDLMQSDAVRASVQEKLAAGMSNEGAEAAAVAAAIESNPEMGRRLTLQEAEALMSGFPKKSVEPVGEYIHDVTYRWKTLLKDYGGIRVRYLPESDEILNVTDFTAE